MKTKSGRLLFITLCLCSGSLSAGQFMINPELGIRNWSNNTYTIQGNTITFDDNFQPALVVRGSYIFDSGLAISGEVMGSGVDADNETAGSRRGRATESSVSVLAHYHFARDQKFHPFVGAGLGSHNIEIDDSNTNASLDGFSTQLSVGGIIQLGKRVGISMEYKYYKFDVDDENGASMKSNVTWFGAGVSFIF